MPRPRRYTLTDLPQHVVQRGNNKQRTFHSDDDHGFYLACLYTAVRRFHVEVLAYALMPNHVHLLLRPLERGAISRVMQSVGRRYVRFINARHNRTGTLWEGRHKTSVVQTDRYLANCHAYIELNPVRAGLTACAEDFPWSSARHYLGVRQDPLITECPSFRTTAPDLGGRIAMHQARLAAGVDDATLARIRRCVQSGKALDVERPRSVVPRPRGRPRKKNPPEK